MVNRCLIADVLCSCHLLSERMTEIRSENEDLRSAAVVADESYQKLLAEKHMLEMDLSSARDDNNCLKQQVHRRCQHYY